MKSKSNPFVIASLFSVTALSSSVFAATATKSTTTGTNFSDTAAGVWSGGSGTNGAPTSADIATWDSTSVAPTSLAHGANLSWGGIKITNPSAAVTIGTALATNVLTIGSSGIDMSTATQNLTLNGSIAAGAAQTWTVAAGRTLQLHTVNNNSELTGSGDIALTNFTGSGTANFTFNPGQSSSTGFTDQGGFFDYTGNWTINSGVFVRTLRNGRNAWGTGIINLAGGTVAQHQNFSGTWTNDIALATDTSSTIDDANSSGARSLKLQGVISGGATANLTIAETGTASHAINGGVILTATNSLSGQVTINSAAVLRVGGVVGATNTDTSAGTGGTLGTATVVNNGTLTLSRSDAWTFANHITSGTGAVTIGGTAAALVTGGGTQVVTMSGTNVYSGATTVGAGRLNLTGSLTSAVTVASGASISGTGSTTGLLTLSSGGGLALAGGATTAGLTSNGATFSGSNVLTFLSNPLSNTEYRIVTYGLGTLTTPANLTHTGFRGAFSNDLINKRYVFTTGEVGATRTWNTTTGTWAVNSGTNFVEGDQKYFDVDAVVFGNIASDSVITLTGALAPSSVSVTNAANTYTFQTGSIAGATSLAKSGAGTLKLTGANTFTGGTNLTAGSIILSNAGALGSSGTITLNTPSTGVSNTSLLVDASAGSVTFARPITIANEGSGTTSLGSSAFAATFQAIFSGAITLNKDVTLTSASGGDRTQFSGGIGGTGNIKVTGTGRTIFITTANTYVGNTEVDGILQLSDASATATSLIPDASNVTVNSGGFLRLAKGTNSETVGGLNGAGTVEAVSGANTLIVGSGDATGSFSGVLKDNGGTLSLTKTGSGTQTLSGPNTYAGPTSITGGTLELSGGSAIANTGAVSLSNIAGAVLKLNANETIGSLAGGGATGGNLNLQANTLTLTSSATTFIGNISGVDGGIVKNGAGNFVLQGSNSFTGTTTVTDGYLVFDSLTSENGGGALTLNGGNLALGTMFVGNSASIGSLSGNSTASLISPNYGGTTGVRTLAVNQTVDGVYQGKIEVGSGSRDMALTKSGSATLTLTAANTYTGDTSVTGGTLVIGASGSLGNTAVTVGGAGATGTPTLGGGGTIGGATIIAAAAAGVVGTHSVGMAGVSNGVGTQTFSNTLSYGTGSIFEWNLQAIGTSDIGVASDAATGTYDQVVANGALSGSGAEFKILLGGNAFSDAFWDSNKSWTNVFSGAGAGSWGSIFSSITGSLITWNSGLSRGEVGTVDPGGTGGYFTISGSSLNWTAVPEPTTALAGLLLGAGLLRRRRTA